MSSSSSPPLSLSSTVSLSDGNTIPYFGLGTWRADPGQAREVVANSLKAGYKHIDAAWIYQNQIEVGQGLADAIGASGGKLSRRDIHITSKVWNHHQSPANVELSIKQTLEQLGTDYLDLLLLHWPTAWISTPAEGHWPAIKVKDTSFTIQDTWRSFEKLVEQKLVRSIGVSNFGIHEIEDILSIAKIKPVVNQVELHPYFNQSKLSIWCKANQIHLTSYSPLGNLGTIREPALTRVKAIAAENKIDESDVTPLKDPVIISIGKKYKKSAAQIIIRWHLQHGYTVIPKTVSETRLKENADVFDFELTQDDIKHIDELGEKKRVRLVNPEFRNDGAGVFPAESY